MDCEKSIMGSVNQERFARELSRDTDRCYFHSIMGVALIFALFILKMITSPTILYQAGLLCIGMYTFQQCIIHSNRVQWGVINLLAVIGVMCLVSGLELWHWLIAGVYIIYFYYKYKERK